MNTIAGSLGIVNGDNGSIQGNDDITGRQLGFRPNATIQPGKGFHL